MNKHFNEHPIFNNSEFFIQTPMIDRLKDQISQCLWNGISGAAIYGSYRIGKTKAINYIKNNLTNCLDETLPSRFVSIAPRDVGTVAGVFKNICHSWDFKLKSRVTADDMSSLICHHLGELSLSNSTRQVLLVVDELQRLNMSQFEAFAELHDKLSSIGSNLFVLFVGNDSAMNKVHKNLNNEKYELIRGRFFTQEFRFYGIREFDELKACLGAYDACRFPQKGKSYTHYFLGECVPEKWRLESLSEIIWSEYHEHFKVPLKIKSWPMQYFVSMVRVLITDFLANHGVEDKDLLRTMIQASINVSGLVKNQVRKAS